MKQTARIISTYAADVSGVCSALYELGGMTVMHDASGCNSTYNTHDEPRWYDMDSMVYISALSEMEAVMGDDEKLVNDIAAAALGLSPNFVAIAGTPIPTVIGTDLAAIAALVEKRTGIPSMGLATNGMRSYLFGAGLAFETFVRRFCDRGAVRTKSLSANILGLTPLDFSTNGSAQDIRALLEKEGISVLSAFAMGSAFEQLVRAGDAQVNLVVSYAGLPAARALQELFGTPYVVGVPVGEHFAREVTDALKRAAKTGESVVAYGARPRCDRPDILLIGESVITGSLAASLAGRGMGGVGVACPLETESVLLGPGDRQVDGENELIPLLEGAKIIVADPLYRPICPKGARFVPLPHEAFSGRIYRRDIPNLIGRQFKI